MATVTQLVANEQVHTAGPKGDFRQEVTDNIVEMLEKGTAPWQKPWEPTAGAFGMPMNPTTEKVYRGGNAIHLMATGLRSRATESEVCILNSMGPMWSCAEQCCTNAPTASKRV